MLKKMSWVVLKPLVMKVIRAAVGKVDDLIDTHEERVALAEKILEERHEQIRDALVKAMEKGHIVLQAKGY